MITKRPYLVYGNVILSIQASTIHYCNPRRDGLPLEEYESVEAVLFRKGAESPFLKPSDVGLDPALDRLFSNIQTNSGDPSGGWLLWDNVHALQAALETKFGKPQKEDLHG